MPKRYFLKLVRKHVKGIATPEEEQLLLSYYNLFELEPDVIALLNREEQQDIKDQLTAGIKQEIASRNRFARVHSLKLKYISVAAAILIGFIVTYNLLLQKPDVKPHVA